MTWPLSRSVKVVIHGSIRCQAAVASCRITVGQDTPYSPATASTARTSPAQAATTRCLRRVVIRANGGTCSVDSVNVTRGHARSPHRHRFFTHHTLTSPSKPTHAPVVWCVGAPGS
jgi:hypothetical protein